MTATRCPACGYPTSHCTCARRGTLAAAILPTPDPPPVRDPRWLVFARRAFCLALLLGALVLAFTLGGSLIALAAAVPARIYPAGQPLPPPGERTVRLPVPPTRHARRTRVRDWPVLALAFVERIPGWIAADPWRLVPIVYLVCLAVVIVAGLVGGIG